MIFAISSSVFTTEIKAEHEKINHAEYLQLLNEEKSYTSKRKHILVELNKEYVKKLNYFSSLGKKDRCLLYREKIDEAKELYEMLIDHQEDIMTEIDEQF